MSAQHSSKDLLIINDTVGQTLIIICGLYLIPRLEFLFKLS